MSGNGYYSPSHQDNALKELRQTSSFTGAYTNIDDAEIEQAMKSTIPDGLLEGFPTPPPPADSSVRVEDTVDFPGQKREKNGQFGAGKQAGNGQEKRLKSSKQHAIIKMSPKEREKVGHEINTLFHSNFKGKRICRITTYNPRNGEAYDYWFENNGFDNYQFIKKRKNRG